MKYLVTGGAGFIGSNLVDLLISKGHDVIIIDNLSTGFIENVNSKAKLIVKDILELEEIKPYFKDIDAVFHLAALARVEPSIHDPLPYNKVNIEGTLSVIKACIDNKVKKLIFSSSSSIYGECGQSPVDEEKNKEPLSPYALQKLTSEEYCKLFCKLFDLNATCLRYFNVYGNRQPTIGAYVPVVGIFFKQKFDNLPLTVTGDGSQTRDFVNVLDVAMANYLAALSDLKGYNYFNIGSGKNYKILDIAKLIDKNIKFIDSRIEPKTTLADIQKSKKMLKWEPTIELFDWIKDNLKV